MVGDYKPILPRLVDAKVDRVNLEFAYIKGYRFASKNPKRAMRVTIYSYKATFKKVKPSAFTLR